MSSTDSISEELATNFTRTKHWARASTYFAAINGTSILIVFIPLLVWSVKAYRRDPTKVVFKKFVIPLEVALICCNLFSYRFWVLIFSEDVTNA